jgi:hypothetical protein
VSPAEERLLARTGLRLEEIAEGEEGDLIGGHIVWRDGDTWVVYIGYPDVDEDGRETWVPTRDARVVRHLAVRR